MNEFMNITRLEAEKPNKTKRKKKKKHKAEEFISHGGHMFQLNMINIPTACEVCSSFFLWPIERSLVCRSKLLVRCFGYVFEIIISDVINEFQFLQTVDSRVIKNVTLKLPLNVVRKFSLTKIHLLLLVIKSSVFLYIYYLLETVKFRW